MQMGSKERTVKRRRIGTACVRVTGYTISWKDHDGGPDCYFDDTIPFPDEVGKFRHVQKLTIEHCPHLKLPAEISRLAELTELHLHHIQFDELISPLAQLPRLEKLTIDHWDWEPSDSDYIDPLDSIGELKNLTSLTIRNVKICELSLSMCQLKNLKHLEVFATNIDYDIPDEIGNLINLESIRFHGNEYLCSFPASIGNLTNLKVLQLEFDGDDNETDVPREIGNLINLERLSLKYCNFHGMGGLRQLPLGAMTKLVSLELHAVLASLPEDIGNLKNLETFKHIHCGRLEVFPRSFWDLARLTHLEMESGEGLSAIPDDVGNLLFLEHLTLCAPALGNLPRSIGNLTRLMYLSVESGMIRTLPDEIGNLVNLRFLRLQDTYGNLLQSLPGSIKNLSNLNRLELCGCSDFINSIPLLPALTALGVAGPRSRQRFTIFQNRSWATLSSLESLAIRRCRVGNYCRRHILSSLPSTLSSLTLVGISNMPSLDEIEWAEFPRALGSVEVGPSEHFAGPEKDRIGCIHALLGKYQHLCNIKIYSNYRDILPFRTRILLGFNRCRHILQADANTDALTRPIPSSLWPLRLARVHNQVVKEVKDMPKGVNCEASRDFRALEASVLFKLLQGPALFGR